MFSSLSRRRVIVLLFLTCMLFITLDERGNPVIDRARRVFAVLQSPFDTAARAISDPFARAWYGITRYDDLERENAALRDQVERQRGAEVEARSAILEYQQLLALNRLTSVRNYNIVSARVVGEAPSNFQNTVEITVGSNQGVAVGMPVTDGAGLVGKITRVYPNSSLVLLISDPQYSVAAEVLSAEDTPTTTTTVPLSPSGIPLPDLTSTTTSTTTTTLAPDAPPTTLDPLAPTDTTSTTPAVTTTTLPTIQVVRETGTVSGQGVDKPLLLRFVDDTASMVDIRVGATIDTAGGTNSLAPQGIPIGVITRIERQSGSRAPLVEVTPNASLRRLNFVSVILFVPNPNAIGR
jgi:rod shape-determining protein MreC